MSERRWNYLVVLIDGTQFKLKGDIAPHRMSSDMNESDPLDMFEHWIDSTGTDYVINRNHIVYIKEIE